MVLDENFLTKLKETLQIPIWLLHDEDASFMLFAFVRFFFTFQFVESGLTYFTYQRFLFIFRGKGKARTVGPIPY
jgi:hypothetical protein